eukprot:2092006-Prymnesium_polylepis.2
MRTGQRARTLGKRHGTAAERAACEACHMLGQSVWHTPERISQCNDSLQSSLVTGGTSVDP